MVYQKMDSTLRGNWPWELDAIASSIAGLGSRRPMAVVCPAFPERSRSIREGRLFVDGVQSNEPSICERLTEAGLSFDSVRGGLSASDIRTLIDKSVGKGRGAVVCDAGSRADLDALAAATSGMDDVFWCGSAGLMGSLARNLGGVGPAPQFYGRQGCILVVVGSASPVSRRQLNHLVAQPSVEAVPCPADDLLLGKGRRLDTLATRVAEAAERSSCVAVFISGPVAGGPEAGHALVRGLAELLAPLLPRFGGLVLTGGEVARAVLSRAGVTGLKVAGEIEAGIPYGWSLGALERPVVTKPGAFGTTESLTHAAGLLAAVAKHDIEEYRA